MFESIPQKLGLYDLLGIWLPGIALVALMKSSLRQLNIIPSMDDLHGISQITIAAVSTYAVGLVLTAVTSQIEVFLRHFSRSDNLHTLDEPALRQRVVQKLNNEGINSEALSKETVFQLCLAYVTEHSRSERPVRFYSMSMLCRNLAFVTLISGLWIGGLVLSVPTIMTTFNVIFCITLVVSSIFLAARWFAMRTSFATDVVHRFLVIKQDGGTK